MSKIDFEAVPLMEVPITVVDVDCRNATSERNFACLGAARALNEIYEDAPETRVVWQPDVYWEASQIAERNAITTVIDVGCGNGEKLVHYFPEERFRTVGLDFQGSLSLVRAAFPERRWIECDLTSQDDLAGAARMLPIDGPVLFILSDVIEHLADPLPLLAWLRSFLLRDSRNRLVISTPDRLQQGYADENGKPANDAHLREWSLEELSCFLASSGFEIVRRGLTRMNQFDPGFSTLLFELACTHDGYLSFLKQAGLIYDDALPRHLLVTTEYAGLHSTGGIGTFVAEQRLTYGSGVTLCLFAGEATDIDAELIRQLALVTPTDLLDGADIASLPLEDRILRAVQQLLFYFPDLDSIQYGDYQGIGCRIAQAKRAGILPQSVEVIVHCHGVTHYLENAHESWFGTSHVGVAEKEKISVEKADRVVFPTEFLRELYDETGFRIAPERITMLRYPYHAPVAEQKPAERIDTLVFFGKRSTMKGYGLFLQALAGDNVGMWKELGVRTITIIGPNVDHSAENAVLLDALKLQYNVEEFTNLNRSAAMEAIRQRATRSICVMPYLADNHPLALLDVTYSNGLPCMVRAGGVKDLFPAEYRKTLMSAPDDTALRNAIVHLIRMPVAERGRLQTEFLRAMLNKQNQINESVKAFPPTHLPAAGSRKTGRATIIVPVFNTPISYLEDLAYALNRQTVAPEEAIFVDDASHGDYHQQLAEALKATLHIPYRLLRHRENKGLAGARNTGLAAAKSKYVINVDSDDVPLNDFVRDITRALESDDDVVAATPYLQAFDDEPDFNRARKGGYVYRPLGDGVIASQLDNLLGHANSGFKREALLEYGGWDETSKSMWEDWALYLKITSSGKKIAVIPKIGCLYRVRASSMLRTYRTWPAMCRLARNMDGLPRFENFRLQAMMRYLRETESSKSALRTQIDGLNTYVASLEEQSAAQQRQLDRASMRAMRRAADGIARYPALYAVLRRGGLLGWKAARYFVRHRRQWRADKRQDF
ncbi:glycosyltransferase [Burkholderia multivorans]|uniref:glycosyltransferase n=1 Tax=Burkholderia multivorans TaxID=87883 RepID=UPI0020193A29|nr:glycosyltransferase [Burkholderia multivorans]MCL4652622.1 glycosyltransferase [Burkholderia multivorans]MCL4654148.1 glycosyltransferase [Burkholderia multivorans]MCO1427130.1 glycosyltransferase [Burkholderia multivorans]UQN53225.1 glycosyltransferase [Burkholderia multivorans]UQO66663.1 glycosyltransferase [Burkholderia multivorans]